MNNITAELEQIYLPQKALVIFGKHSEHDDIYVEAYDMDEHGRAINAHPLSEQETADLAESLNHSRRIRKDYLHCQGLMPVKLLHVDNQYSETAAWYTPAQQVSLLFIEKLGIPCGKANVPALLWQADKNNLKVFALKTGRRPSETTTLYYAPFFNLYQDGQVCMGTVERDFSATEDLEAFMQQWEQYFWNSYFSHLINECQPVKGNIITLWKELVATGKPFPASVLKSTGKQLNSLWR